MSHAEKLPLIENRSEIPTPTWQIILFVAAAMIVGEVVGTLLALLDPGVPPKPVWAFFVIKQVTMTAPMLIMAFVFWLRERRS